MEKTQTEIQFEKGLGKKLKDFTKDEMDCLNIFKELEENLDGR